MLKKITLIATAAALLIGAEVLAAQQDEGGNPQPKQKYVQKGHKSHKCQGFGPQMFDKWLDALAKAHQEKDVEKMGKLINQMQQARQEMQKAKEASGQHYRGFRKGCRGRGRRGQFHKKSGWYAPQAGKGRFCLGLQHREFGRRGHRMQRQGRGRWNMDAEPRGFGRRHQGRPYRDMNDPTLGVPQRGDVNELMQDMPPEEFNWD